VYPARHMDHDVRPLARYFGPGTTGYRVGPKAIRESQEICIDTHSDRPLGARDLSHESSTGARESALPMTSANVILMDGAGCFQPAFDCKLEAL
jgi:hypothetical protein